jgi:hypothetical protein
MNDVAVRYIASVMLAGVFMNSIRGALVVGIVAAFLGGVYSAAQRGAESEGDGA